MGLGRLRKRARAGSVAVAERGRTIVAGKALEELGTLTAPDEADGSAKPDKGEQAVA